MTSLFNQVSPVNIAALQKWNSISTCIIYFSFQCLVSKVCRVIDRMLFFCSLPLFRLYPSVLCVICLSLQQYNFYFQFQMKIPTLLHDAYNMKFLKNHWDRRFTYWSRSNQFTFQNVTSKTIFLHLWFKALTWGMWSKITNIPPHTHQMSTSRQIPPPPNFRIFCGLQIWLSQINPPSRT